MSLKIKPSAEPPPAPGPSNGYWAEYLGVLSVPDDARGPGAFEEFLEVPLPVFPKPVELPAWLSTRASYIRELNLIIADLNDLKDRIENA